MTAGELPSIPGVYEPRRDGHQRSAGSTVEVFSNAHPLDDWLGDISDDDWSEHPTERAERRPASSVDRELASLDVDVRRDRIEDPAARSVAAAEAHRAVIERRRLVAGLVVMVVVAVAGATAVLLLRGGGQPRSAPVAASTTTPAPGENRPAAAASTPSSSTTTPATTPSAGASTFALPEGTKLQRDQGDPALVVELQRALSRAGYDPGPADGTFGRLTEAAVVAFQEANGLSVDGRVGPETASALSTAVAGG